MTEEEWINATCDEVYEREEEYREMMYEQEEPDYKAAN